MGAQRREDLALPQGREAWQRMQLPDPLLMGMEGPIHNLSVWNQKECSEAE